MTRIGTVVVIVVALVVLGALSFPVVAVGSAASVAPTEATGWEQTEPTDDPSENGTETAPGTRLAGAVGVQGAELGGEVESRSLGHQLNRSASADSKAAVLARQANQSRSRLAALRTELTRLDAAYENGTVSEREYRVRTAQLSAQVVTVQRVTGRASTTAAELPDGALGRNGVNVTELRSLRSAAGALTGPERAAVARSVAGPAVGSGFGPDRAANRSRGAPAGPAADAPGRSGDGGAGDSPGGPPDQANRSSRDDGQGAPANGPPDQAGSENATDDGGPVGEGQPNGSGDERGRDDAGNEQGSDGNGADGRDDAPGRSGEARGG
ncbi:hypothetical protein [Salinigranum marinum]|uniref:hypothetical protein n=1 Tax=Salinigranum marinum TaxID=1515595 RepID=UPI002989E9EC|nr:hypothetical protein [Salinigranum marinum]